MVSYFRFTGSFLFTGALNFPSCTLSFFFSLNCLTDSSRSSSGPALSQDSSYSDTEAGHPLDTHLTSSIHLPRADLTCCMSGGYWALLCSCFHCVVSDNDALHWLRVGLKCYILFYSVARGKNIKKNTVVRSRLLTLSIAPCVKSFGNHKSKLRPVDSIIIF